MDILYCRAPLSLKQCTICVCITHPCVVIYTVSLSMMLWIPERQIGASDYISGKLFAEDASLRSKMEMICSDDQTWSVTKHQQMWNWIEIKRKPRFNPVELVRVRKPKHYGKDVKPHITTCLIWRISKLEKLRFLDNVSFYTWLWNAQFPLPRRFILF